jgi:protein SCO1/2
MTVKRLPWIMAVAVALLIALGVLYPRDANSSSAADRAALVGTNLDSMPAPQFALNDQFGKRVTLDSFHGRPLILTFTGATCTTLCPIVAETIHRTIQELGPRGSRAGVVAISTDPEHDTPAAVKKFSVEHGMYHRWDYLVGSRSTLVPIWRAYHLYVAPRNAPAVLADAHTSATYLIDGNGRERILMTDAPDPLSLDRDMRILLGMPGVSAGQAAIPAPEAGHPAPALNLPGLHGGRISLDSLRGKVVVLNFWATWCAPCKSEMPMLNAWYRRMKNQGVVLLGVDQQEGAGDVAPFVRRLGVTYPIALDTDGMTSARFDVAGLPTTLIIDRRGIVHSYRPGILDETYLSAQVRGASRDS